MIAGVLYVPALEGMFVWDDLPLLVDHPSALDAWADVLPPFAGRGVIGRHHDYYRPILLASYVADSRLFGLDPGAFHRTNVVLHALNTTLVWVLLHAFLRARAAASFGALVFALHPIQAQAVALVTGRNDLLLLAPFALALLAHAAWGRASGGRRTLLAAAVLFLYAAVLWTKETGILLPVALLGADLLVHRIGWRRLGSRVGLMAGMAAVAGAYLLVRRALFGTVVAVAAADAMSAGDRVRQVVAVAGYYLRHVVLPAGFAATPYHAALVRPGSPELRAAALACAGFLAALLLTWRLRPRWAFGLLLFLLALAPVSGLAPMRLLILEHRAYVPMLGIALLAAALLAEGAVRLAAHPWPRRALAAAAMVTLATLGSTARARIPVYLDALSLWGSTVACVPGSAYARYAYGFALATEGRDREAIVQLEEALALQPDDEDARLELALALWRTERPQEAMAELEDLVFRAPGNARAWNSLGVLRASSGGRDEGLACLRRAYRLAPDDPVLLANFGKLLARTERFEEAIEVYRHLCEIEPNEPAHRTRLARLLAAAPRAGR